MPGAFLTRWPIVALIVLVLFGATGCGHGSKVQHGNIEVFYKDGATKDEADRLGAYLAKTWGAAGGRRSVQLKKTADGYQFRMVVKKEFQNDEKVLQQLAFDSARVSRDVFDGAAIELHACDEHFATLKTLPPRPDVRYGLVEGKAEVFYAATGDKEDAQRLASYLAKGVANAPAPMSFKLARRGSVVEVHMVVRKELVKDGAFLAGLANDRNAIAANVFPGKTVEVHVCDEVLNVIQVLKK